MFFGVFASPAPTEEAYEICADAGFNHVLIDQNYGGFTSPAYARIMEYCENAGIKAIPMRLDSSVESLYAADFSQYSSFDGIFFSDEPNASSFDEIAGWIPEFEQKYPGKSFYVNLFPGYALEEYLGADYETYINSFVEKVLSKLSGYKQLSVDVYPLKNSARGKYFEPTWLRTLETTAQAAKGTDIETHYFVQTVPFGNTRKPESAADMRLQYSVAMAYGVSAFSVFTYPDCYIADFGEWGEGLVHQYSVRGEWYTEKNPTYFYVQTAQRELLAFDHVFKSFSYRGTQAIYGANNKKKNNENFSLLKHNAASLDGISAVSASEDSLIGSFVDANGTDGYMAVNFTEPTAGIRDTVVIEFEEASKVRVYRKGAPEDIELEDGKLTLDLDPGEGAFVIAV